MQFRGWMWRGGNWGEQKRADETDCERKEDSKAELPSQVSAEDHRGMNECAKRTLRARKSVGVVC